MDDSKAERRSSGLLDLERDLPTSLEDVEILRRLHRFEVPGLLRHPERLAPPFVPEDALRARPTFAGCEPFHLESSDGRQVLQHPPALGGVR